MSYIRKIYGVEDGFIESIGNLEIAFTRYGEFSPIPVCVPVRDFAPNIKATKKTIGAFKVDGEDWVVCQANWHPSYVPANLVAKFAPVNKRLPLDVFNQLFTDAYIKALQIEAETTLSRMNKGEPNV